MEALSLYSGSLLKYVSLISARNDILVFTDIPNSSNAWCCQCKCRYKLRKDEEEYSCAVVTWLDLFFISPFIVPPVLLQTISTLMSLLMACRKCIQ